VAEAKEKRNGKIIESLGFYDPKTTPITFKIDQKKLDYWLNHGAQPTDSLRQLLKNEKTGSIFG